MNTQTPRLPRSKMPQVGTTIFTEMSALASDCGALNVAQGFPDLDTPEALRSAVNQAIEAGHNQYAPMAGNPNCERGLPSPTMKGRATTLTPKSPSVPALQACCLRPSPPWSSQATKWSSKIRVTTCTRPWWNCTKARSCVCR